VSDRIETPAPDVVQIPYSEWLRLEDAARPPLPALPVVVLGNALPESLWDGLLLQ
jgi:hypothetical protein